MVYSTSSSTWASSSKAQDKTRASFQRRQITVMKKAEELSTLCGIEVAVICYGPDGELQTWPRNMSKVREMAEKYIKRDETEKRKKSLTLSEFLGKTKSADEEKKKNKRKKGSDVENPKLDGLSAEELSELGGFLDRKMKTLQERLRFLETQKHKTASPSEFMDEYQIINFCPNQEIYQPASSSDFADMVLPLGFHENPQFSASTVNHTSYDNFGFSSVPCSYNNYIPHLSQEPASNSDFADMVLPMDLHVNPQFSVYDESYASFNNGSVPCSYNNYTPHVSQDPIPLMSYGDRHYSSEFMGMEFSGHDFHSQFPQMMPTANPLQQLGPYSAAASMVFGV